MVLGVLGVNLEEGDLRRRGAEEINHACTAPLASARECNPRFARAARALDDGHASGRATMAASTAARVSCESSRVASRSYRRDDITLVNDIPGGKLVELGI